VVAVVEVHAALVQRLLLVGGVLVGVLFAKHAQAVDVETLLQNFLNLLAFLALFTLAHDLLLKWTRGLDYSVGRPERLVLVTSGTLSPVPDPAPRLLN
jgi:hypothetical protein